LDRRSHEVPRNTAPGPRDVTLAGAEQGIPRLTLLLMVTAQLADLATFGIAAAHVGVSGEIGPLGDLYRSGGFAPVAMAKALAIGAMFTMVSIYWRRTGHGRWLALLVAGVGLFGALTNVLAMV
jgi:hypothetical protein